MTKHKMALVEDQDKQSPKYWSKLLTDVAETRDEAVFQKLHEHFAPLIRGFFMSNVGTTARDVAEDLVQEVMMKVWFKAASFNSSKAAASTWIFTLARNVRIDYLRKTIRQESKTEELTTEDIWDEDSVNQPFTYLHQSRNEAKMHSMLTTLPIQQSECLQKVYIEGKSHTEIAEELAIPLGTVKSRVRLGLKRLQSTIEPEGAELI